MTIRFALALVWLAVAAPAQQTGRSKEPFADNKAARSQGAYSMLLRQFRAKEPRRASRRRIA